MRRSIKRNIMKKVKKIFIIITLGVTVLVVAVNVFDNDKLVEKQVPIVESEITSNEYIISKEMVLGQLTVESQLISMSQDFTETNQYVDDGLFGERHTMLTVNGTYKIGLETKDIVIKHIDEVNGIVYLQLPDPTMLALEIPYDSIEFDKTQGWLRLAMDEEEEKNFYKATEKNIRKEIMENKEIMRQADILNKDIIQNLLSDVGVKKIIFE